MTITTRAGKGSPLTNAELDANFNDLQVSANISTVPAGNLAATNVQAALNELDSEKAAAANFTNVNNTADSAKPVSTPQATALALKVNVLDAETLVAQSQSLHFGAIVALKQYFPYNDSDGGAWTDRCTDKSWENEALCPGTWRQQRTNLAAAWAITGAASGDYYQNTTDGKFYQIGGTSGAQTQAEVFRGGRRKFPKGGVALAFETNRLVIYDTSTVGCPMWATMGTAQVFSNGSSCVAQGGKVLIGANGGGAQYLLVFDFIVQEWSAYRTNGKQTYNGKLISVIGSAGGIDATKAIVNSTVNDIACTVLDNAPVDPATGLPVPTIAVATAGGVSVIKHDGTVVNWLTTKGYIAKVSMDQVGRLFATGGATVAYLSWFKNNLPTTTPDNTSDYIFNQSSIPARLGTDGSTGVFDRHCLIGSGAKAIGCSAAPWPLHILKDNPASPTKGMVAYISNAYNSGWMPGDIRGAWLADTVEGTIAASANVDASNCGLVANGTFAANTDSWTAGNSGTLASVSSELQLTNGAALNGYADQVITTVVGKSYIVTATARIGTATNVNLNIGTTAASTNLGLASTTSATNVALGVNFVATSTTTHVSVVVGSATSGHTVFADNISCRLAEPDRSVKNNGLVINGSLQKTAVAAGAQLVAYSGFSAANYLEQPYNSQLDFGTGDFCVMGWAKGSAGGNSTQGIFARFATQGIKIVRTTSSGATYNDSLSVAITGTTTAVTWPSGIADTSFGTSVWHFVTVLRRAGITEIWFDGKLAASSAVDVGSVSGASPVTAFGIPNTTGNDTLVSLWRISATAPSADQIAHIYRTELPLFQPNAKCTLDGTSTAVTALTYDDTTDLLQVGTSWGRSAFKDLLRVESEATTVGAITTLSANNGAILTGGTSGKYYQPAMLLRDELRRKEEARKALGKVPVFFPWIAATSQVAFVVAKGYTVKGVYSNGAYKTAGTTGDRYGVTFDGFQETVTFLVAPGNGVDVALMCVRSN